MNTISIILVIFSAFTHASWNYTLKKVQGGIPFVWFFTTLTCLLYVPYIAFIFLSGQLAISRIGFLFCLLSVLLHLLYFLFLETAYKFGDLSVVYPITRSASPIITILLAFVLLRESLQAFQWFSVFLILAGTILLTSSKASHKRTASPALFFALLCAFSISGYTLVDKVSMAQLALSPFILDFFNNLGRSLALTPYAFKHRDQTTKLISKNKREALMVAILSPFSYLLILFAMKYLPVSVISPMRQLSIVIGSLMGVLLLREPFSSHKGLGIAMTFVGVLILNLF